MTKINKNKKITEIVVVSRPARVTDEAHKVTPLLCELYAKELGISSISRTDAISRAVKEAIARRTEAVAA